MRPGDHEGASAAMHRQRRHRRAAEAARCARRRAPGNRARLRSRRDRRGRGSIVEQQQEDEDLGDRARGLGAWNARRKQASHCREHDPEQDLDLRAWLERSDPCNRESQDDEAGECGDPPVGFRLPGVIVHAQKRRSAHCPWRFAHARRSRVPPSGIASNSRPSPRRFRDMARDAGDYGLWQDDATSRYVIRARRRRQPRPLC